MAKVKGVVRYELVCGRLTPEADADERALYQQRHQEHERAKAVADSMGMNVFFEESRQRGTWHLDGYIYVPVSKAISVLEALKAADVEVDIADVPSSEPDLAKKISDLDIVSIVEPFSE